MTTVTLEAIQAKQTELAAMIQQMHEQAAQCTQIEIEGCTLELRAGERYAGAVLDEDGDHLHHLVLRAERPAGKLNWQAAMDWAKGVGGTLPSRQESSLLFANCKCHLDTSWHWTSETREDDASYAWSCYFNHGGTDLTRKSYEGSAVAVRLVQIV